MVTSQSGDGRDPAHAHTVPRRTGVVVAAILLALVSGCSGGRAPRPAPTSAEPTTPAPITAAPVTESPTVDPTSTEDPAAPPDGTDPSGPTVLSTSVSGNVLSLRDAFGTTGEWSEARFDVADAGSVQGIGVTLTGCGSDNAAELEFRLAHRFTQLKFKVGQANTSAGSDGILLVEIVANDRQKDFRRIPFDQVQSFATSVKDVNALTLRFYLDQLVCGDKASAIAVIEGLTVTG